MTVSAFSAACQAIVPIDGVTRERAEALHASLAKPVGALGRLETLGCRLAAIAGTDRPPNPAPAAVVLAAADHGVAVAGVTPWPQEVTALMVRAIVAGGAASAVLARAVEAEVVVVDLGVIGSLHGVTGVLDRRVGAAGTANLADGPACTAEQVQSCLNAGAELAADLVGRGLRCLLLGEMGIGNTTSAAAIIAALTKLPARAVTGRGTGVDDKGLAHKIAIVDRAVARLPSDATVDAVLTEVGGFEIAFLAGVAIGGAAAGVPVVLDGVITLAAALAASRFAPHAVDYWIAAHLPVEPGGPVVIDLLGLEPVLDLGLRLGEGTGALLALPIMRSAAAVLREMVTLQDAAANLSQDRS